MQLGACEKSTVATCTWTLCVHGGNVQLVQYARWYYALVQRAQWQRATMYSLHCTVGVHASSARHSTALGSCKDCSAIFLHSGHVTTCIDRSRQKEAALYKVCCSLSATQESNVQPAAVLYRGNYLGAKADLLRVLGKGDITHAWNPERASNQIQWKQLHTRTFCKGGAFRSKLNSGHTGQNLIRYGNLGGS